uniref:Phosphomevalonate kinase n=1 Tax=Caligus rogercresseyi TaxID=217165 RepID=C1BPH9_CALRO|nr:Phosphomevalonate kinase [Caligus rogercresseyi]
MPKIIYLFMGKRKSGKDYVTDLLEKELKSKGENPIVVRLSSPIKRLYAEKHGLDYEKLLSASDYKEKYRSDMIQWSEEIRNKDHGVFCRAALPEDKDDKKSIWIVSDCRRKTDVAFFECKYPKTLRVRVFASEETRIKRGLVFQKGIDDAESECGLDDLSPVDFQVLNDTVPDLEPLMECI